MATLVGPSPKPIPTPAARAGTSTMKALVYHGPGKLIVIGIDDNRLEVARTLNATHTINITECSASGHRTSRSRPGSWTR